VLHRLRKSQTPASHREAVPEREGMKLPYFGRHLGGANRPRSRHIAEPSRVLGTLRFLQSSVCSGRGEGNIALLTIFVIRRYHRGFRGRI
jgi:hypothetical protein